MESLRWLGTTEAWRAAYRGASMGVLVLRGVANPPQHAGLNERKTALEQSLRERYGGLDRAALAQLPVLLAYAAYYKRFKKCLLCVVRSNGTVDEQTNIKGWPQV